MSERQGQGSRGKGQGHEDSLLYQYQREWVNDASRFKIGMMARQTGKTFTTTLELVLDALEAEAGGGKRRWVILSRGERQAREAMLEGVCRHLKAINAVFKLHDIDWQTNQKALEVELPGGSRITALPANPDTARGFSAGVFLDEFAFHQDSHAIWRALFPVVAAGHPIRVVSTPNGKGNRFYELMTDPALAAVWSRHNVDIYRAVREGLPRNTDEMRLGMNDPDGWAQEFELQWVDEASAWLPFDLINSCEHPLAGTPEGYQGGACYIGNDIGSRRDLWVAWVWEQVGDVLWCREIRTLKRASFAEHDRVMDELFDTYRVMRLCMDQTGMGEKPVEDAMRRYGTSRVEGVLFTSAAKQVLATTGKQRFEDHQVRIPMGDSDLRNDLHKLKKITTALGGVRFDADRDGAGHADRAWAAFLGIYAAGNGGPVNYAYHSVKKADYADMERTISVNHGVGRRLGAW